MANLITIERGDFLMTVTVTFDHMDIVGTESKEFESLFVILQAYAKMTRGPLMMPPNSISKDFNAESVRENIRRNYTHKGNYGVKVEAKPNAGNAEKAENPPETKAETPPVEKAINRKDIEAEIKQIALDGKEKGASKQIKEIIQTYGVEKLSDVPDEKMPELLEKVKAL